MNITGPYSAHLNGNSRLISYKGNRCWPGESNVQALQFTDTVTKTRLHDIIHKEAYRALHAIDNQLFLSSVDYFRRIGAEWCNLPLTTLMISSPGEVYAGKTLDYTTDTLPVELSWFNSDRRIFLSESSQFYLELRLLLKDVDRVFSIYNSFRKERADFSHLSEFQHIEFEGHVSFDENIRIAEGLLRNIINDVVVESYDSLRMFLAPEEIDDVRESFEPGNIEHLTLKEALAILHRDCKDDRYKQLTLKHFGAWEEIRLTKIIGRHVWIKHYPLLEIPFYHRALPKDEDGVMLAENADLILCGAREAVGSGVRMSDPALLKQKAEVFNLPVDDYDPYLTTRSFSNYAPSAGFGLGWQRLTQWLLQLPTIWEAAHIPRGHELPIP
jgi:asparaginyl-tRNA synthetase